MAFNKIVKVFSLSTYQEICLSLSPYNAILDIKINLLSNKNLGRFIIDIFWFRFEYNDWSELPF